MDATNAPVYVQGCIEPLGWSRMIDWAVNSMPRVQTRSEVSERRRWIWRVEGKKCGKNPHVPATAEQENHSPQLQLQLRLQHYINLSCTGHIHGFTPVRSNSTGCIISSYHAIEPTYWSKVPTEMGRVILGRGSNHPHLLQHHPLLHCSWGNSSGCSTNSK